MAPGAGLRLFSPGLGLDNGFVCQLFTEGFEPVELLDGAAVVTLGLGLIAQQEGEAVGFAAMRWKPSPAGSCGSGRG